MTSDVLLTCRSETITVQAPHPPSPQPNFVPHSPNLRRRKLKSVKPGSSKFSTTTFFPISHCSSYLRKIKLLED